ncbi:MAG: YlmC/YmxH family sporulation protein [Acutalibacteraceae bacterium]|jgi:YlmC/YmxH family sporulation protein|nr:YlmC/YmxH family sporulation protein [Acutalibacteraceae bacterium]
MICKIGDLRHKEVINAKSGCRLGFVDDVEFDTKNAVVVSLVIYGRLRCFGLLGRDDDIIIKWDLIDLIGEDTILVSFNPPLRQKQKKRFFTK